MKLIDVRTTADLLNVSESMVYKLAATGTLSSIKIGDCVRFKEEDIEYFIQKNTKQKEDSENV